MIDSPGSASARGRLTLVTGPTRSGKSDWAETLARRSPQSVLYIATAARNPEDLEWEARIQAHRDRRPASWIVWEVPHTLTATLTQLPPHHCVLIDSLGTWIANELEQSDPQWQQTQAELLAILQTSSSSIIVVAEEVGWGVVPAYPAGRLFCDRLGALVRAVGAISDDVYLVTAGYAISLKQLGQLVP